MADELRGPTTPYYGLQNISVTDRLVRDLFPRRRRAPFASRRVARPRPIIRFAVPPVIGDIAAAIGRIESAR